MAQAARFDELVVYHEGLERKIAEELARPRADDLQIAQLKREKLRVKDQITSLQAAAQDAL